MDVDRMSGGESFEASRENKMPTCTDVQLETHTSELTGHASQVNRVKFIATLVLKRLAFLYYYYYYYYSLIV